MHIYTHVALCSTVVRRDSEALNLQPWRSHVELPYWQCSHSTVVRSGSEAGNTDAHIRRTHLELMCALFICELSCSLCSTVVPIGSDAFNHLEPMCKIKCVR